MGGRIDLGKKILGAAGQIVADRIDEVRGRALPRTQEQLVRVDVLNDLFVNAAPDGAEPLPRIRAARLPGIDFESSNCRNFLIDVEPEDPAEAHRSPNRLYAKIPCDSLMTQTFAYATGFWESEVTFCERIASKVPVRVPQVYAATHQGARFVLLLEDLNQIPGARLFINRDMAAGTTPDIARRCLQAFAELHAPFWGIPVDERERILPYRLHTYMAPDSRQRIRALNASGIGPTHRIAPKVFTKKHVDLCRQAIEKWDALLETWYAEPLTLIHGDSHLANCFEYDTPEGRRVGLLDFQGVSWCKGIRDVQYFLINSVDSDTLADCEDEMIRVYVDALAGAGVELDLDEARAQYRALAFQTLMVAVVSLGLGAMPERQETMLRILERSVAAIDRLGFADWLAAL